MWGGREGRYLPEGIIVIGSEFVVVSDALFECVELDEGFGLVDLVFADYFICLLVEV